MYKDDTKYFCDVCEYGTNRHNSFKKHLETQKHVRNSRESSVTIDIIKFKHNKIKKVKNEEINIEIYPENKKDEPDSATIFLEEVINELSQLRQENILLKMNVQYQQYPLENIKEDTFTTVFDNDFTSLFT